MMRAALTLWLLVWAGVLLFLAAWSLPARAHDWYPQSCCSGQDCYPMSWDEIDVTPDGYVVKSTGELIPFGLERLTPPEGGGMFHRCSLSGNRANKTIGMSYGQPCFWAPPTGS